MFNNNGTTSNLFAQYDSNQWTVVLDLRCGPNADMTWSNAKNVLS